MSMGDKGDGPMESCCHRFLCVMPKPELNIISEVLPQACSMLSDLWS